MSNKKPKAREKTIWRNNETDECVDVYKRLAFVFSPFGHVIGCGLSSVEFESTDNVSDCLHECIIVIL